MTGVAQRGRGAEQESEIHEGGADLLGTVEPINQSSGPKGIQRIVQIT